MLQVAISGGEVRVVDVGVPMVRPGTVLVRTTYSLISAGTEGVGVTGKAESLAMKALRNPELVKKVVDRVQSHGLKSTLEIVRSKIGSETPIGYSAAGRVVEVGDGVTTFKVGDRVACSGAGVANHAEYNVVPVNLVSRIPDNVSFQEAAFVTLGAIALQGVRRANVTLGESIIVMGLGLLGQITAQLLAANGCRVIGVDVLGERVKRARALGMQSGFTLDERDFAAGVVEHTDGVGADAVIVCAAGSDPALLNRAFDVCRRKGRVVLVGDVPIRIQRDKIYKKELDFLISTSYGPGRYDPIYEERGQDYPLPYVRWTEGRNLQEILRLVGSGQLKVKELTDAVFPIDRVLDGYLALKSEARPIGVLIQYPGADAIAGGTLNRHTIVTRASATKKHHDAVRVGIIGYGSYFTGMLLPLLETHPGFVFDSVSSRNGLTVRNAQKKNGFAHGFTDWRDLVARPEVDLVYVATRHDQHYPIARAAIEAGKAVFVEKPMTMTSAEGEDIVDLVARTGSILTVGFNRRFSPHSQKLKALLKGVHQPKTMLYRVNAGALPPDHWLLDRVEGGGRLLGEGVHFFDFFRFLTSAAPVAVCAGIPRGAGLTPDNASVVVTFDDGSVGTLVYTGQGGPGLPKERIEVHAGGNSYVVDDFRKLNVFGQGKGSETKVVAKGQKEHLENLYRAIRGEADLGVTALDGYWATWCAEQAMRKPLGG